MDHIISFENKITGKVVESNRFIQHNIKNKNYIEIKNPLWIPHSSYITLIFIHINPMVSLKSKEDIETLSQKFRNDMANNLADVWKAHGFSRKRKITLPEMQQNIRDDKVDVYIFTYFAKLLEKNFHFVNSKQKDVKIKDDAKWIVFRESETEGIEKYIDEVVDFEKK